MSRYISCYQSQDLLFMVPRGRGRGNRFASLNDVPEREETMHEEQLVIRLQ